MDPIGADGFFVVPTLVNFHDQAGFFGAGGNFSVNSVPAVPDDTVPGIPGTSLTPDDFYVMSIETILELNAGAYRLGVNSGDGFRLSAGRGPGEVVGIQLGTAGDRGFANTFMDFVIAANGLYPFRLMWWESAGTSAGVEFFVVDLATGTKTLINDLTGFTPIKAYRESVASRPYISRVLPTVNYSYAFADEDVIIDITDGAIPLGTGSAELRINGAIQTITANKTGNVTTITRDSSIANLLRSGVNTNVLVYSFTEGGTNNVVTNTWTFTVPAYTWPIPAANKVVPASSVTGSGFHVRAHQIDRSRDTQVGNGGRHTGNNMPGPEMQIASLYINPLNNLPYTNNAAVGPNPDGSWDVPDTLNHNSNPSGGNTGIFQGASDREVPGLPGTGTSVTGGIAGIENYAAEITTYLDLKAGAHVFGLNVDDGYTVISAPNAQDTLGTLLAFRNGPGGNAGNPLNVANAAFNVVVPEDGIYPFRILFWQGGVGVNIEFLEIDRGTGTQIPINDINPASLTPNPVASSGNLVSSVTAYNTYMGPVRPWVKFSVYPMPYIGVTSPLVNAGAAVTLWQNRDQQSGPGPIMRKLGLFNGSWNSGELQNASTAYRPFGDSVGAVVADLGAGSVGMVLDGVSVTPTVTDIPSSTDKLVLYTPPTPLASTSNHITGLIYGGTTNYWIFNVITNVSVPAGVALPSSNAVQTARGFRAKVVQSAAARPGGNTVAAAEAQLAGTPANVATNGPNPDGSYTIPGIINWNVTKSPGGTPTENGNFAPLMGGPADDAVPGIPGTGLTGTNVAAEIFAYLDLPKGYQKFGINGDDGWRVQIGTPGQTSGTVLFSHDRTGGATDFPFAFITPVAGLYPIRLVWYQGTAGGNLEFFTYGPNNEKIPVNHPTHPSAIKAYYEATLFRITSVTVTGGNVTVTWTGGGTLYTATSLDAGTVWTARDSGGSYTTPIGTGNLFFRAQQ